MVVGPADVFAASFANSTPDLKSPCREDLHSVPGAFLLRNALDDSEVNNLRDVVCLLHRSRAESVSTQEQGRRDSQHHIPLHVSEASLATLAQRLRPLLPGEAGRGFRLRSPGREISSFLRCYYYKPGEASTPHYDRSWVGYSDDGKKTAFSAYSVLLYLQGPSEGGETTFFEPVKSVQGTRPERASELVVAERVAPRSGDVLVFPHGKQPGCHPDVFHEGSEVIAGEKMLIRTDILYDVPEEELPPIGGCVRDGEKQSPSDELKDVCKETELKVTGSRAAAMEILKRRQAAAAARQAKRSGRAADKC